MKKNSILRRIKWLIIMQIIALLATSCMSPQSKLSWAVQNGYSGSAEKAITAGADVNGEIYFGTTPLFLTIKQRQFGLFQTIKDKHLKVAEVLISHGADVNAKNKDGQAPLHIAASNEDAGLAELLISHGATVNIKGAYGQTPLHIAASEGAREVAKLLIEKGANINARTKTIVPEVVSAKLHGAGSYIYDPYGDKSESTLRAEAQVYGKDYATAQAAIATISVLAEGFTPPVAVKPYVRMRGKKTFPELYYPHVDSERYKLSIVFLSRSFSAGETPLHEAVSSGKEGLVELLLANGADANSRTDVFNATPLHYAAALHHNEIVKLLLANGADINPKAKFEITYAFPLDYRTDIWADCRMVDEPAIKASTPLDFCQIIPNLSLMRFNKQKTKTSSLLQETGAKYSEDFEDIGDKLVRIVPGVK